MEQIKVEITLVATDARFDFYLPMKRPLCEILPNMAEQIEYADKTVQLDRDQPLLLCDVDRKLLLDPTRTLSELGVHNGARLTFC